MEHEMNTPQPNQGHNESKSVMIFDITANLISNEGLPHTQEFAMKLNTMFKRNNENIVVETFSSNKLQKMGPTADLILLTPNFSYIKNETENNYPNIPVYAIQTRDYGLLNIENIYNEITSALQ